MGHNRKAKNSWLSVHWPMIFLGTAAIALFSGWVDRLRTRLQRAEKLHQPKIPAQPQSFPHDF
jgi:hypothetical protein